MLSNYADIDNVGSIINIETYSILNRYNYGVFHSKKGEYLKNIKVFILFLSTFTYR